MNENVPNPALAQSDAALRLFERMANEMAGMREEVREFARSMQLELRDVRERVIKMESAGMESRMAAMESRVREAEVHATTNREDSAEKIAQLKQDAADKIAVLTTEVKVSAMKTAALWSVGSAVLLLIANFVIAYFLRHS